MTDSKLTSNERCINWPCAMRKGHVGPCSTSPEQRSSKERVSELISYWESCDPGDETFIREDILRDTIALLKSEGDCTSALGDAYRVFCPKHDTHKARYTDGRPELDDRCPTCVIESLEDRAHGAEVGAAILRDRLERATQPPPAVDVAPIAKLTVRDGLVQRAGLYAPGLPDGDHDVFPVPLSPKGELRPHVLAEPPSAPASKQGHYYNSGYCATACGYIVRERGVESWPATFAFSEHADRFVAMMNGDAEPPADARWKFIQDESLHLVPFAMPTGAGDADIGWRVLQSHMGKGDVVIAEVYRDRPAEAIDAARAALTKDAGECGACDKPGEHCANVHGICSRHGGRAHETSDGSCPQCRFTHAGDEPCQL